MEEMTRRELAFCYIYSQEIQKENSKAQVKLFLDSTEVEDGRTREYVKNVANGIKEHGEEITEKIAKNLKTGWTIERISKVDVSLLKLAIYELEYTEIPFKVVINEAVEIAKKYGEDTYSDGFLVRYPAGSRGAARHRDRAHHAQPRRPPLPREL